MGFRGGRVNTKMVKALYGIYDSFAFCKFYESIGAPVQDYGVEIWDKPNVYSEKSMKRHAMSTI